MKPMIKVASKESNGVEHTAQRLVDALPIPALVKSIDQRVIAVNQSVSQLLLVDQNDLKESGEEAFLCFQDAIAIHKADRSVTRHATNRRNISLSLKAADGRAHAVATHRSPLTNDNGDVWGVLCVYEVPRKSSERLSQLREQKEMLESRIQRVEHDLDNAWEIQKSILEQARSRCSFLEVAHRYQFVDRVGGDFLCTHSLNENEFSFIQADLTGHGVSAALFTALLKHVCSHAEDELRRQPSSFLSHLDSEFYNEIPNGFFTAFAGTLRKETSSDTTTLSYASAAHPSSVIIRRDGVIQILKQSECAIGLMDVIHRKTIEIELNPGDRLYCFTDGFVEALSPGEKEWGLHGVSRALQGGRFMSLDQSIAHLYRKAELFQGQAALTDDATVLAIQVH